MTKNYTHEHGTGHTHDKTGKVATILGQPVRERGADPDWYHTHTLVTDEELAQEAAAALPEALAKIRTLTDQRDQAEMELALALGKNRGIQAPYWKLLKRIAEDLIRRKTE